ncbi:SCP domain-containing protein [Caenorhabditis elegans]|uniref:SCP domain-containing protein n=1 Tax=Caenorhabditis elegans TaxID=6239 RepID=O62508_CAEEL|nr:SCP domain-containing protein [Caenorhabditis elegans]CAB05011.1 SCP domain-containing protein [Caenorhabditis elegans]|eukprot:NP_507655.1 SCP-Like extracellular protein [Caenorhabditis elegans]
MRFLPILFLIFPNCLCDFRFGPTAQREIVDFHNSLRSQLANGDYVVDGVPKPPAKDMMKMKWDPILAGMAKNNAATCPSLFTDSKMLGRNYYHRLANVTSGSLDKYALFAVKKWERQFQERGWKNQEFRMFGDHRLLTSATQMVWATTRHVGCGVNICDAEKNLFGYRNKVVVICEYQSKGNIHGLPIYKEGPTCSACPASTKCERRSGLCF